MQFILEVDGMDKTTAYMIEKLFSDEVTLLGDMGDSGDMLEYDRLEGWVKKAQHGRVKTSELYWIVKETEEEYPGARIFIVMH